MTIVSYCVFYNKHKGDYEMLLKKFICLRCGGKWIPRTEQPGRCPCCGSMLWNKAVKEKELGRKPKVKPEKENVCLS